MFASQIDGLVESISAQIQLPQKAANVKQTMANIKRNQSGELASVESMKTGPVPNLDARIIANTKKFLQLRIVNSSSGTISGQRGLTATELTCNSTLLGFHLYDFTRLPQCIKLPNCYEQGT